MTLADTTKEKAVELTAARMQMLSQIVGEGHTYADIGKWCLLKAKEEETVVAVNELIEGFPLDAANALALAVSRMFGFVDRVPTPGWFGDNPPTFITIRVDAFGGTREIYVGRMQLPTLDKGFIETIPGPKGLMVGGQVKQKDMYKVKDLCSLAREILAKESLLKAKIFRIDFDKDDGPFLLPEFIRPNPEVKVILNDNADLTFRALALATLRKLKRMTTLLGEAKRGFLFHGEPGTGKTSALTLMASVAMQHGWTTIYATNARQLPRAFELAMRFQPALLFAEDVDILGEEDGEQLRNIMDAVDTKGAQIMVAVTTNHELNIDNKLLRAGRLDTHIRFELPDAHTAAKIVQAYDASGSIMPETDFEKVGEALQGLKPSSIREILKMSKAYSEELGLEGKVDTQSLVYAAERFRKERVESKEAEPTDAERLSMALSKHVEVGIGAALGNGAVPALLRRYTKATLHSYILDKPGN